LLAHSKFLFAFSNIADMLNCTNRFSKRKFDTPLTEDNYQILKEYADNFISYIESLKCADGKSILKSNKKTGFLGLSLCLKKMFKLFDTLKPHGLTYLLTYKLSQDYLEKFFSAIRSREGFNNNPNALQFKTAYKRLLVRHEIKKIENGNCLFDGVEIPHVSTTRKKITRLEGDVLNKSVSDFGHDYISTFWQLSQYVENVVNYIADYISKKKKYKKIDCSVCPRQIIGKDMPVLSKIQDWGTSYRAPSRDVTSICTLCEKIVRQNSHRLTAKNMKAILSNEVFNKLGIPFDTTEMNNHVMSQDILNDHRVLLCKLIIEFYLKVRFFHEASTMSAKDEYIRQKYTKLILFKGQ
jgi:hypothetical protein